MLHTGIVVRVGDTVDGNRDGKAGDIVARFVDWADIVAGKILIGAGHIDQHGCTIGLSLCELALLGGILGVCVDGGDQ